MAFYLHTYLPTYLPTYESKSNDNEQHSQKEELLMEYSHDYDDPRKPSLCWEWMIHLQEGREEKEKLGALVAKGKQVHDWQGC